MSTLAKLFAVQMLLGGGPRVGSLLGSDGGLQLPRVLTGVGAPSASTLPAGNGRYNGFTSGYVTNVALYTAGTSFAKTNVLTLSGGTGTAVQVTVDEVGATGNILDWRVTTPGVYTVYPSATLSASGGAGTGAAFILNFPPPDLYFDITDPDNPVLYVCKTAGSSSTSVWKKVAGGTGTGGDPGLWL